MRAFVAIGGLLFAAVFIAHVLRLVMEGPAILHQPIFLITSIAALAAAVWAAVILLRGRRPGPPPRTGGSDMG